MSIISIIMASRIFIKSIFLIFIPIIVHADHCPSPDTIKDRKISRQYEWSIDERKSLEDVIGVEKLFSVRLKNNGEFIACYYSGGRGILRLDAAPPKASCSIQKVSGEWNTLSGEEVCRSEDLYQCKFEIKCN